MVKLIVCPVCHWFHVIDGQLFSYSGCGHELCVRCALYLCSTCNIPSEMVGPTGSIPCPLCRHGIVSFVRLPGSSAKEMKLPLSLGLCTPCMLHSHDVDGQSPACLPEVRKNRVVSVSSDFLCPVTCSPFPSVAIPLCTCNDGPCPSFEPQEVESQDESSHRPQTSVEQDKMEGPRLEKTSCSSMFWGRRSCSREHQCNSEINTWLVLVDEWSGLNILLTSVCVQGGDILSYQSPTLKISKIHVCYQFFFGWPHGNGFWFGNKAVECPLDVFLKYLVRVVKIVLGGGGGCFTDHL